MINESVTEYPLQFLYPMLNVVCLINVTVVWASFVTGQKDGVHFKVSPRWNLECTSLALTDKNI